MMEYTERPWFIEDESNQRPGYCCLAIREATSVRLVCDIADVPDDVPGFVERAWEEARKIAFAPQLLEILEHLLYAAETRGLPKYADGELYRGAVKDAYDLIDQVKGRK